jgi:hypothetical protein
MDAARFAAHREDEGEVAVVHQASRPRKVWLVDGIDVAVARARHHRR